MPRNRELNSGYQGFRGGEQSYQTMGIEFQSGKNFLKSSKNLLYNSVHIVNKLNVHHSIS